MAREQGKRFQVGMTGSSGHWVPIVPDDDDDLPDGPCRAIWVGGDGDIYANSADGDINVPFIGVTAGSIIEIRAARVLETTTATNLVALY